MINTKKKVKYHGTSLFSTTAFVQKNTVDPLDYTPFNLTDKERLGKTYSIYVLRINLLFSFFKKSYEFYDPKLPTKLN